MSLTSVVLLFTLVSLIAVLALLPLGLIKPVEVICKAAGYQKVIYIQGEPMCFSMIEVTRDELAAMFPGVPHP